MRVIWLDNGPTIDLEPGAYTLTIAIDLATARDFLPRAPCKGFPAEFASRSFPATIELRDRALELYHVTVETRPSKPYSRYIAWGASFWSVVEPSLIEEMPGFRYLSIGGNVRDDRAAQRHWNVGLRPVLRRFSVLSVEVFTGDRPTTASKRRLRMWWSTTRALGERDDDLHEALTIPSSLRVFVVQPSGPSLRVFVVQLRVKSVPACHPSARTVPASRSKITAAHARPIGSTPSWPPTRRGSRSALSAASAEASTTIAAARESRPLALVLFRLQPRPGVHLPHRPRVNHFPSSAIAKGSHQPWHLMHPSISSR